MTDGRSGIVLVTRNFPPLRGGMERLNQRMAAGIAGREPLFLVGPQGCGAHAPAASAVAELPAAPAWRFLLGALPAALRLGRRQRPRWFLAGSGLAAPVAWLAARLTGARCAVYVHGLDLVVPHGLYQRAWLPAIRRCDAVIANSANTARLAQARGVARVDVVHPGTDLPPPARNGGGGFREALGLGDAPLMLSVGRLTPRKGLVEFVADVLPSVLRVCADARLVLIGSDASDALTRRAGAPSLVEAVVAAARSAGVADAVVLVPPCDDDRLAAAYRAADVHVFPVRDIPGDVEGFGMVAIEAAAHGLPTVAYRVGGVPDAVADGLSGELVQPGDPAGFADAVVRWMRAGEPVRHACRIHAAGFAWTRFDAGVRAALADGTR